MEENTEKKETVEEETVNKEIAEHTEMADKEETEIPSDTVKRETEEKKESSEEVKTETVKQEKPENSSVNDKTEEKQNETVKQEEKKQTVKKKDKEKKNSGKGKTALKIIGIFAIVFVAAFGGTYAAISWMDSKLEEAYGNPFDSNEMPFDYEEIDGNGSDGYSSKTNNNSAGLGIYIRSDSDKAEIYSFTDDSLADDAGLQAGDIITAVDGNAVESYDDVVDQLKDKKPGDKVKIEYERNGEKGEAEVELIDRSSSSSESNDSPFNSGKGQMMQ